MTEQIKSMRPIETFIICIKKLLEKSFFFDAKCHWSISKIPDINNNLTNNIAV